MALGEISSQKATLKVGKRSQSYELVKAHLPLVQTIARSYARGRQDLLDDLIQVGAIGLLKALRTYNPLHPNRASFRTLATSYIRGEIRHYLRDCSSLIHVPRPLLEINARVTAAEEKLSQMLGRSPTIKELSTYSGLSEEKILEGQRCAESRTYLESLDIPVESQAEDKYGLCDIVPDRKYQEWQIRKEERDYIAMGFKNLGEPNRQILEHVFFNDLSQKETANKLGLSEMRVSRVINRSIEKLKEMIRVNATFSKMTPAKTTKQKLSRH